jgi:hypothetical protein
MWVACLHAPYLRRHSILGSPVIFIMLVDYMWIEKSKAFILLCRFGTADNQQVSLSPAMRHCWWNQKPNVTKFTNTESWKVYQYHYQTQLPDLRPQSLKLKNPWNLFSNPFQPFIPDAQNSVGPGCPVSLGPQYTTCFMSSIWRLKFWSCSYIFGKFMHSWTVICKDHFFVATFRILQRMFQ